MICHSTDLRSAGGLQQAIGRQIIQSCLQHLFLFAALQNPGNNRNPNIVSQLIMDTLDAGQNHLRLPGNIHRFKFGTAITAVSACFRVFLPKIIQNVAPQALLCFAVAHHHSQPLHILPANGLPLCRIQFLIVGGIINQKFRGSHIGTIV